MKAAIVVEAGQAPRYGDFPEPVPASGEVRVTVNAAALSNVVKSRASGKHYSSSGQLPFVVGIDGVGHLDDGRRVYFVLPKAPLGSMVEITVIRPSQCVLLPDDLDDATAAAIANPGMSSWAALKERARLEAGENGPCKWSNRHRRASGRSDRQISRRKKGRGDGQKCGSPESTVCLGGRCDHRAG